MDASVSLGVILFSRTGIKENRFNSIDSQVIIRLEDEIAIIADRIIILYINTFIKDLGNINLVMIRSHAYKIWLLLVAV